MSATAAAKPFHVPPQVVGRLQAMLDAEYADYEPRVEAKNDDMLGSLLVRLYTASGRFQYRVEYWPGRFAERDEAWRAAFWHAQPLEAVLYLNRTRTVWDRGGRTPAHLEWRDPR